MKFRSEVSALPIAVVPITPAPPLVSPMVLLKVITPLPEDAFTFNPPNSSVTPIAPLNVTAPVPEVIVKTSSSLPFVSIAPWKVTAPAPVPVSTVVVALLARSTPAVLKATAVFVVVKVVPAVFVISIF